MTTPNIYFMIL